MIALPASVLASVYRYTQALVAALHICLPDTVMTPATTQSWIYAFNNLMFRLVPALELERSVVDVDHVSDNRSWNDHQCRIETISSKGSVVDNGSSRLHTHRTARSVSGRSSRAYVG